jgi:hypothetical protein
LTPILFELELIGSPLEGSAIYVIG